jgi:hydroxyacyl-ACP dehydratase HTD2-like protein with hotdog domain
MSALPEVGAEALVQTRTPSALDLFMFSASSWLLHRIHYDTPFTTGHDGHPGLLIHGPLQGV